MYILWQNKEHGKWEQNKPKIRLVSSDVIM